MDTQWTIEQLTRITDQALVQTGYAGQFSGRVRGVPDLRTIRYYTTLGMLDPPAAMRGRKALYGPQHVLQLVAIKRLQAQGLSLVQVQQALAGADRQRLAAWAGLPERFWESAATHVVEGVERAAAASAPEAPRAAFWAASPAVPQASAPVPQASAPVPQVPNVAAPVEPADWAWHVPVREGVELVLRGVEPGRMTPAVRQRLAEMAAALAQPLGRLQLFS